MLKRFCKMFSDNSTGRWAAMLPKKARELSENILQKLFNKLLTQTVSFAVSAKLLFVDRGFRYLNLLHQRPRIRIVTLYFRGNNGA